jgi:hypothetical protein
LARALQAADEEGIGRQQLARRAALHMPLPEAGIELFDERGLLCRDLDRPASQLLLQLQPALVPAAEPGRVQELLDGDRRDAGAFERQHRLQAVAAIGRMLERQRLDARHRLWRRGHRM